MRVRMLGIALLLLPCCAFAEGAISTDAVGQSGADLAAPVSHEVEVVGDGADQADQADAPLATETQPKPEMVCDNKGRARRIDRPDGGFSEFFYHPTLGKVSAVVTNEVSTVFTYNKSGDLTRVYNTRDQLITLDYDRHKNIRRMVETNKTKHTRRELTFQYNSHKKPIKISMVGKGQINVQYDKQGEISQVKSKQGAQMALAVTEAFQTLLQVVSVAKP